MIATHLIQRTEPGQPDRWLTVRGDWSTDQAAAVVLPEREAMEWIKRHEPERSPGETWEAIEDE